MERRSCDGGDYGAGHGYGDTQSSRHRHMEGAEEILITPVILLVDLKPGHFRFKTALLVGQVLKCDKFNKRARFLLKQNLSDI